MNSWRAVSLSDMRRCLLRADRHSHLSCFPESRLKRLTVAGFAILLPVLSGCGGASFISQSAATATSGKLQASPSNVSFGSIPTGQTTATSVALVNQGSASVQVSQMAVAGKDFAINWTSDLPITVAAGATYNVNLSFSPTSTGASSGQLTVTTNSPNDGALSIGLNGTGTRSADTACA